MLSALDGPAINGIPVNANNTNVFTNICKGIYVGQSGNVNIQFGIPQSNATISGSNVSLSNCVFVNVVAGSILPVRANIIYSTSTTANSFVILY